MGFFGSLFGSDQAKAAKQAAAIQAQTAAKNRKLSEVWTKLSLDDLDSSLDEALGAIDTGAGELRGALGRSLNQLGAGERGALSELDQGAAAFQPYSSTGTQALSQIAAFLGLQGPEAARAALDGFQTSPGFQFRMDQGTQALDRSASARGGLYSGAAGKALTEFGQGLASEEYNNTLARLMELAGMGFQGATGIAGIAGDRANTRAKFSGARADALLGTGGAMADIGGNRASAILGTGQNRANVRTGGLSAITGANTQQGQAQAGGILGAANARAQGAGNILNTALGLGKIAAGFI